MHDQNFVIVGGGTTGWLLAVLLLRRFPKTSHPQFNIHLVESPDIATIGVGEGTLRVVKHLFDKIKVHDEDWMPPCDATYKVGIDFVGWGSEPRYFHPFGFNFHTPIKSHFFPRNGEIADTATCEFIDAVEHPTLDQFMDTSWYYCPEKRARFGATAYHFDAQRLAGHLKHKAIELGLCYHQDTITRVEQHPDGRIHRLYRRHGLPLEGDWFFDCTGFHALLAEKTLAIPYLPEKRSLLCDRALTARIPQPDKHQSRDTSYTISTTGTAGWFWQIPLQGKDGCGYVYASDFLSEMEAVAEFQQFLKQTYHMSVAENDIAPVRFCTGKRAYAWQHNCVSFGLANNFIEPLEATAIGMTSISMIKFLLALRNLDQGADLDEQRQAYNQWNHKIYDSTKDFIIAHYLTAARDDTAFWQANHREIVVPISLQEVLESWTSRREIKAGDIFTVPNWFTLLVGQGYKLSMLS